MTYRSVRSLGERAHRCTPPLVAVQIEQLLRRLLDEDDLKLLEHLRDDLVQREQDVRVRTEQGAQHVLVHRRLHLTLDQLAQRGEEGLVQVAASLALERVEQLYARRLLRRRSDRRRVRAVF